MVVGGDGIANDETAAASELTAVKLATLLALMQLKPACR